MIKLICVAKCPELDDEGYKHCTCTSLQDVDDMYTRYPDGCPCGNNVKWEVMENGIIQDEVL